MKLLRTAVKTIDKMEKNKVLIIDTHLTYPN